MLIAERYGISKARVEQILGALNEPRRPSLRAQVLKADAARRAEKHARRQAILDRWNAGMTCREIAADLGEPYTRVRTLVEHKGQRRFTRKPSGVTTTTTRGIPST